MFVDTSFCVDLLREQHHRRVGPATRRLQDLGDTPLEASVFVVCELQAGARLSDNPERELRTVGRLAASFGVVYPDATFPVAYGEVEAYLRKQGKPIPTMDLLIGVQARILGIPLLTRDTEHFGRIPGLVVETY
ncbi:type II toxin-antitoxin system VapC family toxin [Planctomycetota bacterium]